MSAPYLLVCLCGRAPPFVVRRRRIACLPMVGGDVRDSLTHSARIRPAPPAPQAHPLFFLAVDHGSMEFRQNARPRAKATSRRPLKTRGKSGMINDRSFPPSPWPPLLARVRKPLDTFPFPICVQRVRASAPLHFVLGYIHCPSSVEFRSCFPNFRPAPGRSVVSFPPPFPQLASAGFVSLKNFASAAKCERNNER